MCEWRDIFFQTYEEDIWGNRYTLNYLCDWSFFSRIELDGNPSSSFFRVLSILVLKGIQVGLYTSRYIYKCSIAEAKFVKSKYTSRALNKEQTFLIHFHYYRAISAQAFSILYISKLNWSHDIYIYTTANITGYLALSTSSQFLLFDEEK